MDFNEKKKSYSRPGCKLSSKKSFGRPCCKLSSTANLRKILIAIFYQVLFIAGASWIFILPFEFDFFNIYAVVRIENNLRLL